MKLRSRNGRTFLNIVVTYVLSQEDIQEKFKILHRPRSHLAAIAQEFNPGLAPLSLAKRTKDAFRSFPPTNEECAKLVGLPPGKSILHR